MRVKNVVNVDGFFKAIAKCKGKVELITDEGDILNLASKLTQIIGLTTVFSNEEIDAYEILCADENDYDLILEFLVTVEE